ncbi:Uma2 family endonuclease [Methylomagnum sp.]
MSELEYPTQQTSEVMPSLNHSYLCIEILQKLLADETILRMPELTLDIEKGITPDISIFPRSQIKPNFLRDVVKFQEPPRLAIEILSPIQTIQELLEKAAGLIKAGVKAVWTVEPYGRTVFVTTPEGERIFHGGTLETDGIKVDFSKIFNNSPVKETL